MLSCSDFDRSRARLRRRRFPACAIALLCAAMLPMPFAWAQVSSTAPISTAPAATPQPSLLLPRTPRPMPPRRASVPGDDDARVAQITAEFEALCNRIVSAARMPGLAAVLVRHGEVISLRGVGVSDTRTRAPVGADTVFRIASLSKAFASSTAGLLTQRGELAWEDPVREFVPAFVLKDERGTGIITLRDLLSHRTGLPRNALDRVVEQNVEYPRLVEQLRTLDSDCAVGDCYAYQNVAFSASGDLIYASTGESYSVWAKRLLLDPLEMRTASFGLDAIERSSDWAKPHIRSANGFVPVRPKPTYYRLLPAAGVNASARDMGLWLIAQLGHRPQVLPREVLDAIQTPQVQTPYEKLGSKWRRERLLDAWYGLGWRVVDYSGHRVVWHAGAVQGYRAMMAMLPDHDFGVVVLWNAETPVPSGLMPTVLDRYLGLPTTDWLQLDLVERANARPAPRPRRRR